MKKEASDLEAKVEKMMMEKVRASSPPRSSLRWASSARPERCWAAAGLDIVVRRRTRRSRRWRRTSMWRP